MVKRLLLAVSLILATGGYAAATEVNLADWASALPPTFHVFGSKVEPTYVAAVEISRDGDTVSVLGGAPAWAQRSRETITISQHGDMRHEVCPKSMDCSEAPRPAGFLSTAALISESRKGRLSGSLPQESYGGRAVVCVPAEKLGIRRPILDPCFDIRTGAAIAQKNRFSSRFDGPSLDPITLRITR
jgi:hypothetical protein